MPVEIRTVAAEEFGPLGGGHVGRRTRHCRTGAGRGLPPPGRGSRYGRYGFGCATDWAVGCLDPRQAVFAAPLDEPEEVRLERVDPATVRVLGPQVYERYR